MTAVKQNLEPLVVISNAPTWATRSPTGRNEPNWNVDPRALADFAEAAARRFSGTFKALPRVRYWQVWNEPNLSTFFNPQLSNQLTQTPRCPFPPGKVVSADRYRKMVNATAQTLHRIRPDNVVIAGGLSPFCGTQRGRRHGATALHAQAALHVRSPESEADVQGDRRIRRLGRAPVHGGRAHPLGVPPGRRVDRRLARGKTAAARGGRRRAMSRHAARCGCGSPNSDGTRGPATTTRCR